MKTTYVLLAASIICTGLQGQTIQEICQQIEQNKKQIIEAYIEHNYERISGIVADNPVDLSQLPASQRLKFTDHFARWHAIVAAATHKDYEEVRSLLIDDLQATLAHTLSNLSSNYQVVQPTLSAITFLGSLHKNQKKKQTIIEQARQETISTLLTLLKATLLLRTSQETADQDQELTLLHILYPNMTQTLCHKLEQLGPLTQEQQKQLRDLSTRAKALLKEKLGFNWLSASLGSLGIAALAIGSRLSQTQQTARILSRAGGMWLAGVSVFYYLIKRKEQTEAQEMVTELNKLVEKLSKDSS